MEKGGFWKAVLGFWNFGDDFWGLVEMFEGDFADMWDEKLPLVLNGGTSGPAKRAQMGSEDPHRREQNIQQGFCFNFSVGGNGAWRVRDIWQCKVQACLQIIGLFSYLKSVLMVVLKLLKHWSD